MRQLRTEFYGAIENTRKQTARVNMVMELDIPTLRCAKRYLVSLLYDGGTVKQVARWNEQKTRSD